MLPQALGREVGDRLVVVGRHEARAGVDVDRREAVDDLLAQAQDRQVALLEWLAISPIAPPLNARAMRRTPAT